MGRLDTVCTGDRLRGKYETRRCREPGPYKYLGLVA